MKRECCDVCYQVLGSEPCYRFLPSYRDTYSNIRVKQDVQAKIDFATSRKKPEDGILSVSFCVNMTTTTSENVTICKPCFDKLFYGQLLELPEIVLVDNVPTFVAEPDC